MRRATHLFGQALRETGQALDRLGLVIAGNERFRETFSRHRSVMNIYDKRPLLATGVYVAPNASVVGEVLLLDQVTVWYGAVLRGDRSKIRIGHQTNIQDRAVLSTVTNLESGFASDLDIGEKVTVGHGALLTSCSIANMVLIGQGAVVEEGCVIEKNSIIAAGAVLTANTRVPTGQLWAGNPAKYVRDTTEADIETIKNNAAEYVHLGELHSNEFLPFGTTYQHAEQIN
eukprot:gene6604-9071_t